MAKDEIERLVADVSSAVGSSGLRSLLRGEDPGSARASPGSRLARLPASALDDAVRPVRAVLEGIDAGRLLDLELFRKKPRARDAGGPRVRDGIYCRPISDRIEPTLDGDAADGSSVVRYLHVAEVPDEFTIGVFVFGPHEQIPLHDHPEMCVLSRVLYGDLRRSSLDLAREGTSDDEGDGGEGAAANGSSAPSIISERQTHLQHGTVAAKCNGGSSSSSSLLTTALSWSATWLQHNLYGSGSGSSSSNNSSSHRSRNQYPEGTKLAFRHAVDVLEAPAVAVLYPHEGNLHAFAAGPHGAAVLDVLLPPYDDGCGRDCTYYEVRDLPAGRGPAGGEERRRRATPCLVVPTGWPETFHCVSGRYNHLGDADGDGNDSYSSDGDGQYDSDDQESHDREE